jgi:molecular chaperone GrpE
MEDMKGPDPAAAVPADAGTADGFVPGLPGAEPETDRESELEQELAEAKDKYLRTLAEVENFKKRVARERVEERAYAAQEVLQSLLPVVDNLERALASAKGPDGAAPEGPLGQLVKGVELVNKQMEDALKKQGVGLVETVVGQPFDPNFHQPLLQEPSEGDEGVILEVLQKGYRLGDRLLRPSMVKVSVKP